MSEITSAENSRPAAVLGDELYAGSLNPRRHPLSAPPRLETKKAPPDL
jgi:hypothetical protein